MRDLHHAGIFEDGLSRASVLSIGSCGVSSSALLSPNKSVISLVWVSGYRRPCRAYWLAICQRGQLGRRQTGGFGINDQQAFGMGFINPALQGLFIVDQRVFILGNRWKLFLFNGYLLLWRFALRCGWASPKRRIIELKPWLCRKSISAGLSGSWVLRASRATGTGA